MYRKRLHSAAEPTDDSFLKRLRTKEPTALRYSKVVVRFGRRSEEYEFNLPLLPLVTHSVKLRRCMQSVFDSGKALAVVQEGRRSAIVTDLPGFHCDEDIFRMIEDICYGVMDENENDISTSNVVRLFSAGEFLEIQSVKCRASTFLEENVFCSWKNCLDVIATFDYNVVCSSDNDLEDSQTISRSSDTCLDDSHFKWCGENTRSLFERCRKAFVENVPLQPSLLIKWFKVCDIQRLLRLAQVLPAEVAKDIYQSCRAQKYGLYMVESSGNSTLICFHEKRDSGDKFPCRIKIYMAVELTEQIAAWVERLPNVLPDLPRRSLFVLNLSKTMRLASDSTGVCTSTLRMEFLCPLLFEATELSRRTENNGLEEEIMFLEKLVSEGLGVLAVQESSIQKQVFRRVMKFTFGTFLSIVKHFNKSFASQENIVHVARYVDCYIREHRKAKSLSAQQALIIYREFPNNARPSHVEFYETLKVIIALATSPQDVVELTKLLDYDKRPADIVEKLFEEMDLGCEPRLVKRLVEIQRLKQIDKEKSEKELIRVRGNNEKSHQELIKVRGDKEKSDQELMKLRADKEKSGQELIKLQGDKEKSNQELIKVWADKDKINQELIKLRADKEKINQELIKVWGDKEKSLSNCVETRRGALKNSSNCGETRRRGPKSSSSCEATRRKTK